MSSGRTGCGSGMMDFFSVSLDKAFLMSAAKPQATQQVSHLGRGAEGKVGQWRTLLEGPAWDYKNTI